MHKSFNERKKRVWIEMNIKVANLDLEVSEDMLAWIQTQPLTNSNIAQETGL